MMGQHSQSNISLKHLSYSSLLYVMLSCQTHSRSLAVYRDYGADYELKLTAQAFHCKLLAREWSKHKGKNTAPIGVDFYCSFLKLKSSNSDDQSLGLQNAAEFHR